MSNSSHLSSSINVNFSLVGNISNIFLKNFCSSSPNSISSSKCLRPLFASSSFLLLFLLSLFSWNIPSYDCSECLAVPSTQFILLSKNSHCFLGESYCWFCNSPYISFCFFIHILNVILMYPHYFSLLNHIILIMSNFFCNMGESPIFRTK